MTLFMLLHGRPAFLAPTLPEMYTLISTQAPVWTATEGKLLSLSFCSLLSVPGKSPPPPHLPLPVALSSAQGRRPPKPRAC